MYNLQFTRIDSIDEIDLDTVTVSDICWHYGTGISTAAGSKRAGTYKPGYRRGVMTNLGDIRRDIWRQGVEHIIQRDNEGWLVDALLAWEKAHNYAGTPQEELYDNALALYSGRRFDDPRWPDFFPFNWQYRPDVRKEVRSVAVIMNCCGKQCDIPQEQVDHAYKKQIFCPQCGCFNTFSLVFVKKKD